MAEDLREEATIGFQPGCDFLKQLFVVLHVLEHFNGDDRVEAFVCFERVRIGGEYSEAVIDTTAFSCAPYVITLRG